MSWLVLSWFLAFGYLPASTELVNKTAAHNSGAFYQDIGLAAVAFDRVKLHTDIRTYDTTDSGAMWFPYRADYTIGMEILAGPVTIGVQHECVHPVIFDLRNQELGFSSSVTEVYVRIDGQAKLGR
jgi:hypothetical protein